MYVNQERKNDQKQHKEFSIMMASSAMGSAVYGYGGGILTAMLMKAILPDSMQMPVLVTAAGTAMLAGAIKEYTKNYGNKFCVKKYNSALEITRLLQDNQLILLIPSSWLEFHEVPLISNQDLILESLHLRSSKGKVSLFNPCWLPTKKNLINQHSSLYVLQNQRLINDGLQLLIHAWRYFYAFSVNTLVDSDSRRTSAVILMMLDKLIELTETKKISLYGSYHLSESIRKFMDICFMQGHTSVLFSDDTGQSLRHGKDTNIIRRLLKRTLLELPNHTTPIELIGSASAEFLNSFYGLAPFQVSSDTAHEVIESVGTVLVSVLKHWGFDIKPGATRGDIEYALSDDKVRNVIYNSFKRLKKQVWHDPNLLMQALNQNSMHESGTAVNRDFMRALSIIGTIDSHMSLIKKIKSVGQAADGRGVYLIAPVFGKYFTEFSCLLVKIDESLKILFSTNRKNNVSVSMYKSFTECRSEINQLLSAINDFMENFKIQSESHLRLEIESVQKNIYKIQDAVFDNDNKNFSDYVLLCIIEYFNKNYKCINVKLPCKFNTSQQVNHELVQQKKRVLKVDGVDIVLHNIRTVLAGFRSELDNENCKEDRNRMFLFNRNIPSPRLVELACLVTSVSRIERLCSHAIEHIDIIIGKIEQFINCRDCVDLGNFIEKRRDEINLLMNEFRRAIYEFRVEEVYGGVKIRENQCEILRYFDNEFCSRVNEDIGNHERAFKINILNKIKKFRLKHMNHIASLRREISCFDEKVNAYVGLSGWGAIKSFFSDPIKYFERGVLVEIKKVLEMQIFVSVKLQATGGCADLCFCERVQVSKISKEQTMDPFKIFYEFFQSGSLPKEVSAAEKSVRCSVMLGDYLLLLKKRSSLLSNQVNILRARQNIFNSLDNNLFGYIKCLGIVFGSRYRGQRRQLDKNYKLIRENMKKLNVYLTDPKFVGFLSTGNVVVDLDEQRISQDCSPLNSGEHTFMSDIRPDDINIQKSLLFEKDKYRFFFSQED